jgi:hydrogenase maturation protein HypF
LVRAEVLVRGFVQGVGFRPFCYRLASELGLSGFVRNTGDGGVQIVLEGERDRIVRFLELLRKEHPPLADVRELEVRWTEARGEQGFRVLPSEPSVLGKMSIVPPDIAICERCLAEMSDPSNRRYRYPFTTCVDCGPRFTIITGLPYDRALTSMAEFPLCDECSAEYYDPSDRRYRAEPTCCPRCGPSVFLCDGSGERLDVEDPLGETARLLDEGHIVAIKGIGGIHIATKATDDGVLERLRRKFRRPQQPFAVMSLNLEAVRSYAEVTEKAEALLKSVQRPIVLLRKRENFPLSDLLSPGLDTVGVMLAYTGIHYAVLSEGRDPAYVMTSANLPGLPMVVDNDEAISALRGLVEYFLLHNRRIVNRCDDSVVRFSAGFPVFIRRSRGYAPLPLSLKIQLKDGIVALGGDLCVTGVVTKDGSCFPTQHIGDVSKLETLTYLRSAIGRLLELLRVKEVRIVACDMHPSYSTTAEARQMAEEFGAEVVQVQHHHAHLASLAAEHGLAEIVGIAADGAGYGPDGTVWGGEVLFVSGGSFKRLGGLRPYPMPGGDLATIYPARMVAGILWGTLSPDEVREILLGLPPSALPRGRIEVDLLIRQLERGFNVPMTSSLGRLLDAVSCLLSVCFRRTYEGEPAMKLEALASAGNPGKFRPAVERVGDSIDQASLLLEVLEALGSGAERADIAAGFHVAVARTLAELAVEKALEEGVKAIGVSGGVFYNDLIAGTVRKVVMDSGLRFFISSQIPLGDGGLSAGQAVVASVTS